MSDKLQLEITSDEDFRGNWPNNIRLQVLDTADSAEETKTEPLPLPPAPDADRLSTGTWPVAVPSNTSPRRPCSLEAAAWLDGREPAVAAVTLLMAESGGGGDKPENSSLGLADEDWSAFCRICHDGAELAPLITACRCTGSMEHVHNDCLIHWILSSFNTHCEICLYRYRIGTTGMRFPHHWKLPVTDGVERYHVMLCVVAVVVLAAVISFLFYVSTDEGQEAKTYRNSPLAPALYAVYAVLGLVCLGLATAELHYTVRPLLERFRLTNMNLLVVPYDQHDLDDDADTLAALSFEYITV